MIQKCNNVAEYSVRPNLVIVHNPCDFGLKSFFETKVDPTADLKDMYLFRQIPNNELFDLEHKNYVSNLKKEGLEVVQLQELLSKSFLDKHRSIIENNPNHVYTRDAMINIPWLKGKCIIGRMNSKIRETEPFIMQEVARQLGLEEIVTLPEGLFLEGGDVIPFEYEDKRVLLIGYDRRTMEDTLFYLRDTLIANNFVDEIIGIKLAEWRINLDGGFVPVSDKLVVTHPESIISGLLINSKETVQINPIQFFEERGYEIIATTKDESIFKQTCNCFCIGDNTIFTYSITDKINNILSSKGIHVIGNKGEELVKGTGGPRCMTRPVYL